MITFDVTLSPQADTIYVALYRATDNYYRSTGTTFVAPGSVSDSVFRTGLYEVTRDIGNRYSFSPGDFAAGTNLIGYVYLNNDTVVPGDLPWRTFSWTADGEGGALGLDGVTATVDESAIATAVAAALTGVSVSVQSTVLEDGTIELVQGDDYDEDDGREITIRIENYAGPSISGATVELGLKRTTPYNAGDTDDVLTLTGTGAMDDTTAVFTFEATSAETAALESYPPEVKYNYRYQLRIVKSGNNITLAMGAATVKQAILT